MSQKWDSQQISNTYYLQVEMIELLFYGKFTKKDKTKTMKTNRLNKMDRNNKKTNKTKGTKMLIKYQFHKKKQNKLKKQSLKPKKMKKMISLAYNKTKEISLWQWNLGKEPSNLQQPNITKAQEKSQRYN